ncbi:MAG: ABC transporter permease, partial [Gemmatimonadales bacterium]
GLARRLGVEVGDTIVLLGQTAYRSLGGIRLVVGGLAESGIPSWDDIVTVLPLDQAQRLLDLSDGATEIVVLLRDPDHAAAAIEPIRAALGPTDALEVRTWLEQGPLIRTLQSARGGYSVVFLLLMGMAGLVIVNTMLMTVMERAQEHGVQSALGMRKRDLLRLIVTEGAVIGALGAVAGAVAGTVVAVTLGRIGIDASQAARTVAAPFQGVIHPVWSWWHSMLGVVVGVATAALATLYPAWRLRRLRPAEALRS